jgi:signal transduction histidine kinase
MEDAALHAFRRSQPARTSYAARAVGSVATSRGAWVAAAGAGLAVVLAATGVAAYAAADFHGNLYAGNQLAIGASGVAVGTFVARRRPDHPLGWVLLAGGTFSTLTFAGSSVLDWMVVNAPERVGLGKLILHGSIWGWIASRASLLVLAPLAFPTGWPTSRSMKALWWLAITATTVTCVAHSRLFTFDSFAGDPPEGSARLAERVLPWGHRAIYVLAVVALTGMVLRVVRLPSDDRRRYLPFAIALGVLAVPTLNSLYADAFGEPFWTDAEVLEVWAMAAVPVVLAVGVLRHGVLDITVAIRRTTVYAILATIGVVTYVGTVSLFSLFVQQGSGAGPAVATGFIAVGVLPVHAWTERFVARKVFGNRANPYEVVTALGAQLEQAPPGDQALQLVADTLAEQLRLPFVAVEVVAGDTVVEAARHGEPRPPFERFPLAHQGEVLGALVVAHRSEREPFRASERELLSAFARQAGVVAHNAALSQALLHSRLVLVHAREEERRRIRRDLHDGLGPTLATVSLGLGAAAERLQDDSELSALLRDLETELQDAIADIRRLVYDLRPPALDELGLVRALCDQAAHLAGRAPPAVIIDVDALPAVLELPSAVELAAYRVALEAMTNVVRHARAERCWVTVECNHQLRLRVEDDGVGVAADAPRGVGLRSMHERVIELGGSLRIEPRSPRGTTVLASFPLQGLAR